MTYKQELLDIAHRDALLLGEQGIQEKVERTISTTFAWVAGLLLLSFGTAYATAMGFIPIPFSSTIYRISRIAGFALILVMSRKRQSMSYSTLATLLIVFALLEGIGLTGVFYAYNIGSIYQMFLTCGIVFGLLSFAGYKMRVDVTRVGPILMIALVGLILSLVINSFRQNTVFDLRISVIGLIVFGGFVLYDMQILKQEALINDERIPLLMSLGLFINFINIFLFLLRLFGNANE